MLTAEVTLLLPALCDPVVMGEQRRLGLRPGKRTAVLVGAILILAIAAGAVLLPRGPSLSSAEALLLQAPVNDEPGSAIVTCRHTGLFDLLGNEDDCTIRYASGHLYRCRVQPPRDAAGISASCGGPFRH
jgi:hypothetical protein